LVVFTNWLSITPAVCDGVRPSDIRTHATSTVDDIEQAVVAHPVEMVLHRCEGRKALGQLRLLAPCRCDIPDYI